MGKVCGVVGQASYPAFEEELDLKTMRAFLGLMNTLEKLIKSGVEEFVVSMDREVGLAVANLVLLQKKKYPHVRLTCLLPWEEQAVCWPESVRSVWFSLIPQCDREVMLEYHRSEDNDQKRDDYLMDNCDSLLAVWDQKAGPVWRTMAAARHRGLPVKEFRLKL